MRPGRAGDTRTRAGASRLMARVGTAEFAMCHPLGSWTWGRCDGGSAWNQAAKSGPPLVCIAGWMGGSGPAADRGVRAPNSHHANTYVAAKNAVRVRRKGGAPTTRVGEGRGRDRSVFMVVIVVLMISLTMLATLVVVVVIAVVLVGAVVGREPHVVGRLGRDGGGGGTG